MQLIQDPQVVLSLLEAGAVLEQTGSAPQRYTITYQRQSAAVSGGVIQQLQVNRRIRQACKVSGRVRFVAAP